MTHIAIQLGPDLRATSALLSVYAITNAEPVVVCEDQAINGHSADVDISALQYDYFYAVATIDDYRFDGEDGSTGERNIPLLGVFSHDDPRVQLSEPTSIANAYAFRRLMSFSASGTLRLSGSALSARIAYQMRDNFVHPDGRLSEVISSSPNALETNAYALFNSLATLLYYCIVDTTVYAKLLRYTLTEPACRGSAGALFNLVSNPFRNAKKIYKLIDDRQQRYLPSLTTITPPRGHPRIPNQWSLSVKINRSGAQNFLIGGPAYVVFDKDGKAWLNNNVTQGTPNSSAFCSVLNPDGSPWQQSPVWGGGLLGAGFGIAINNRKDTIYVGNFGWGPTQCNPQTGSVSVFKSDGTVVSPPNGYTNAVARIQGMNFDRQGNLWMCSWGSQAPLAPSPDTIYEFADQDSSVVVYLDGNPEKAISFPLGSPDVGPFGVALDSHGNAFVSTIGNGKDIPSAVYKLRIEADHNCRPAIVQKALWQSDYKPAKGGKNRPCGSEAFRQVQVNQHDEVFVGGIKSNRVIKFDNDLNLLTTFNTNINGPWGLQFDADGTLFVANFFPRNTPYAADPDTSPDPTGPFGVAVIYAEDFDKAQLMTLPSAGDPVMLDNGLPLYGNLYGPSYDPLQRMTSTNIDQAGNLWAINNWKPDLQNNLSANPGGDGAVIFVGIAAPEPA